MKQTTSDESSIGIETFVVGDLRVDVGQQRVTRSGIEIALPNLSFRLLIALIRGAPNVQSLDALMERVWPGLIVSPETVNKRATLLREALGDDAKEPRYISAVRGRGYRLIAEVRRAETLSTPPEALTTNTQVAAAGTHSSVPIVNRNTPTHPTLRLWPGLMILVVAVVASVIVGRTMVKNHRSSAVDVRPTSSSSSATIGTSARTVAVMPFENIGANAADAYLARGLPEMILNRLSGVTGLDVIARNSSFALPTANIDSHEIGRRLNCGYLISGSVQRHDDRLRVTVQLVDAMAGTQIWSAHFDRALSDIFSVEDEIAEQVTAALSARVAGLQTSLAAQMRSSNIEAYLAYLRGRAMLGRFTVTESEAAAPYFEKAIDLDPNFAAAYASLYDARLQAADLRFEDLTPVRRRYRPLIDRALAIDPHSGAAYFARAMWGDSPSEARNADFLRGVTLDPSNGRGLTAYAEFLDYDDFGWVHQHNAITEYPPARREEAKHILQRALQIDPMSPGAHFDAATGGLEEGGAAVVEQKMLAVLELDPDFVPALYQTGKYRWMFHSQLADAVQILERAIALDPLNPKPRHTAMAVYLDLGDETAARAVAAGTAQGTRDALLLNMYAGNWRAAGLAAYDAPSWVFDDCISGASTAVRDHALKAGGLSRAIDFIVAHYYLQNDQSVHLDVCNIGAAIELSQLLDKEGKVSAAQALRRAAMAWNDANIAKYAGGTRRNSATALLLDGQKDAALEQLAEDLRSGNYIGWWYTLRHDPNWMPLRDDPRFRAIAADVQGYVDAQRRQLEELRGRGIVPAATRLGNSAPKPGTE